MRRICRFEFGRPRRARCPLRKSRTWPDSKGSTQVWQMPIRQPNGIWMPTCSPASKSEVAPSTSTVLSDSANVTVPPSPPLSVLGDDEALHVQVVFGHTCFCPHLLDACRASPAVHMPRSAGPASRGRVRRVRPRSRGGPCLRSAGGAADIRLGSSASSRSSSWKITSSGGRRRMDVHDVGLLTAVLHRPQHRHDGRDAAARRHQQQLRRWWVG